MQCCTELVGECRALWSECERLLNPGISCIQSLSGSLAGSFVLILSGRPSLPSPYVGVGQVWSHCWRMGKTIGTRGGSSTSVQLSRAVPYSYNKTTLNALVWGSLTLAQLPYGYKIILESLKYSRGRYVTRKEGSYSRPFMLGSRMLTAGSLLCLGGDGVNKAQHTRTTSVSHWVTAGVLVHWTTCLRMVLC